MKSVKWHPKVISALAGLDFTVKRKLAEAIARLAEGEILQMPLSRPMSTVASGTHELRLKDGGGQIRIFYFLKVKNEILVFHIFRKKQQKTSPKEIETAKKRLKELL